MTHLRLSSILGALLLCFAFVATTAPPSALAQEEIEVTVPHLSGEVGETVEIPITTEDISGEDITSYQFRLVYDGSVLDVTDEVVTGEDGVITPGGITLNTERPDTVNVVFADDSSISGSGTLLKIQAEVVGEGTSELSFDYFLYENSAVQTVPSTTVDGAFTTTAEGADVDADGRFDFPDVGVSIVFSGVSGSGSVDAAKYGRSPVGTDGISESNVSSYRFVITADSQLSFDSGTEVRFDVGSLAGIENPSNVTVYSRSTPGQGSFSASSTTHDSDEDELVITTDSFSEFVMASNTEPLPVEVVSFTAQRTGDQAVNLQWRTASESNNAGFSLQRRSASDTWSEVGFVDGEGTTSEPISYEFTDRDLPYDADAVRYRLKQVDTDGTTHLGPMTSVDLGAPPAITLETPAPNPASSSATIRYAVPDTRTVRLQVYDMLGRHVKTVVHGTREGRSEEQLNTTELPNGVYMIRLQAEDAVKTKRLTVVH